MLPILDKLDIIATPAGEASCFSCVVFPLDQSGAVGMMRNTAVSSCLTGKGSDDLICLGNSKK